MGEPVLWRFGFLPVETGITIFIHLVFSLLLMNLQFVTVGLEQWVLFGAPFLVFGC